MENFTFQLDNSDAVCPSTPKRRKISRGGFESIEEQFSEKVQKNIDEVESQMKRVRMALKILYKAESETFRKFISKNGSMFNFFLCFLLCQFSFLIILHLINIWLNLSS